MTPYFSIKPLLVGTLLSALLASPTIAGIVTFSDTNFANTDWSMLTVQKNNGGSIVANQSSLFTNTAPWARFVEHNINAGPNSLVAGLHHKSAAFYDPSMQGKVDAICFSIEYDFDIPGSAGSVGLGALLNQGTKWYAGGYTGVSDGTGFTNYSAGPMTATDFYEIDFSGSTPLLVTTSNPDFSATGGAMTFGFITANSNSSSNPIQYSRAYHFDDWSVSVKSIPEPGSTSIAVGLLSLLALRRRRS